MPQNPSPGPPDPQLHRLATKVGQEHARGAARPEYDAALKALSSYAARGAQDQAHILEELINDALERNRGITEVMNILTVIAETSVAAEKLLKGIPLEHPPAPPGAGLPLPDTEKPAVDHLSAEEKSKISHLCKLLFEHYKTSPNAFDAHLKKDLDGINFTDEEKKEILHLLDEENGIAKLSNKNYLNDVIDLVEKALMQTKSEKSYDTEVKPAVKKESDPSKDSEKTAPAKVPAETAVSDSGHKTAEEKPESHAPHSSAHKDDVHVDRHGQDGNHEHAHDDHVHEHDHSAFAAPEHKPVVQSTNEGMKASGEVANAAALGRMYGESSVKSADHHGHEHARENQKHNEKKFNPEKIVATGEGANAAAIGRMYGESSANPDSHDMGHRESHGDGKKHDAGKKESH